MIAKDLYSLLREVETLEKQLRDAPGQMRQELEDRLRKAKAERDRMQRALEGAKEPLPYRKPL